MKCPNCQASMLEKIQVCPTCETNYTNAELVEMLQLKFLLTESIKWPNFEEQRAVYAQRWHELQHGLKTEGASVDKDAETVVPTSAGQVIEESSSSPPVSEPVSLSQWLFSEAAIKLALYGGGFLLVLAGLIFIGANWSNLPAAIKLLVTLSFTGVMYGSGLSLLRIPKLQAGGLALLAVASGFVPLNFAVLHIYLLNDLGIAGEFTWLMGSVICLFIYMGTTHLTRGYIFSFLTILAALSGITVFLNLNDSPFSGYVLVYALFPAVLLVIAALVKPQEGQGFIYWPNIITASVLIVVLIPFLIWTAFFAPETSLITLLLVVMMVLYGVVALVTGWEVLLLIALLGTNLFVAVGYRVIENFSLTPVTISYSALGVMLLVVAVGLRLIEQKRWSWPFYLVAFFNLGSSYLVGLFLDQPWPMVLSFGFAAIAFGMPWVEQPLLKKLNLLPIPTYIGLLLVFIGHFYLLDFLSSNQASNQWPIFTASLCSSFLLVSWLFRFEPFNKIYGTPLYWVGAGLMIVPAIGVFIEFDERIAMITFIIIGLAYILDGMASRWTYQVYLGTGVCIGAIWFLLILLDIHYFQAYALPLGLWLLILSWIEKHRRLPETHLMLSLAGLLVILGSAFIQSIDSVGYASLLFIESIIVLSIGFGMRSRSYVFIGLLSLLLNGIAQFLPAFAAIPRFIQIGSIGTLLLGGGLFALLLREQIFKFGHILRLQLQDWEL